MSLSRLTGALLALSTIFASPARADGELRVAVLAGNNRGGEERATLRYATTDARRLAEALVRLGGFEPDNVMVLEEPDREEILSAIQRIGERARPGAGASKSLFVFYFSGHADGERLFIGSDTLALSELKAALASCPASVVITILDACNSGSALRVKGGQRRPAFLNMDNLSRTRGRVMLTSAAQGELAQESDDIGGSFFTHFLLSGLFGDADEDGNRRVTLHELYAYVFERTVHRTADTLAGVQHPSFDYELSGEGALVLSSLDGGNSGLALGENEAGTYLIFDRMRRRVVAEVHKNPGERRTVPLPPGKYLLKKRLEAGLLTAAIDVGENRWTELEPARMDFQAFEDPATKGWDLALSSRRRPFEAALAGGFFAFTSAPAGGAWSLPLAGVAFAFNDWPARRFGAQVEILAGAAPHSMPLEDGRISLTLVGASARGGLFREFHLGPLAARAGLATAVLYLERRFSTDGYHDSDRTLGLGASVQAGASVRIDAIRVGINLAGGAAAFPWADRVLAPFVFGGVELGWGMGD